MNQNFIRITHTKSKTIIAEGPLGWGGITAFECNLYISRACLKTDNFRVNFIPGLCFYKFLYVWLNFKTTGGVLVKNLGWKYWLPNPLFPFIWFRVAVPRFHPELEVEEFNIDS